MSLSNEDSLRLNVLIRQELRAVRIDESSMTVHALTGKGEVKVVLAPNCRDEQYLRKVRELLSTHALGSPGGYPVFLKRWTRMGQTREQNLDRLLLLGEPEAVVAVAHAPGLNETLARHTWWAMPTADIARRLLENKTVAGGALGQELANYLLDYMPFETEPQAIIDNVRLVLQPGLINEEMRRELWDRAGRKTLYYVGFLLAIPDELPQPAAEHVALASVSERLETLAAQDNPYARQLKRLLSAAGQAYLQTLDKAVAKLVNQDMTVALLQGMENYFEAVGAQGDRSQSGLREMDDVAASVRQRLQADDDQALNQCLAELPELSSGIEAMLCLSMVGEAIVNPIFSQTDAMGSVMRKKLEPVTQPLRAFITRLQQPSLQS